MSGWEQWAAGCGFVVMSAGVYVLMKELYRRYSTPLLLPVVTAGVVIMMVLSVFHIPYETYMQGGQWINQMLGPAVVALAYPLYRQRHLLRRYGAAVLGGACAGSLTALVGGMAMAEAAGADTKLIHTILPKSVTTPVAMDLSQQTGGIPSLTAAFVILAGVTGVLAGPYVFQCLRMQHEVGRGVGFGSASHAIGTSKALENGEKEGALSSVAMTVCAVLTALICPLLV
ncbi:hypothetical protein GCM10011571_13240 [Marinithermofilum abyssi]|uniref:LrgB family protein n=1 Tax=Marinithermofilum abyssi TaxID=1571185 RepID=A0A8J2VH18_9BACL|nr:LrgB family protein [Marinithermofilum abyssi]GGE13189.1 hypothetical protein GCM10011571_13240 [Marinithermofilum abyssi]